MKSKLQIEFNALAFAFRMTANVRMVKVSDNFRAAGYMSLSMAGFVLNDTMIKIVSEDLSLFQVIFFAGSLCIDVCGTHGVASRGFFL